MAELGTEILEYMIVAILIGIWFYFFHTVFNLFGWLKSVFSNR
jgi:hypothetical protein